MKNGTEEFFVNPFYDGILMFIFGKPLPPKQRKAKKQNRKFEEYLKNHLKNIKQEVWPITGKVLICLTVSGPEDWLENIDIDNVSKCVLDCLKGIVYTDDKSIYTLFAEKRFMLNKNGLMIGIKKIKDHHDYFGDHFPPYFVDQDEATKENIWWLVFDDSKTPIQY